MLGEGASLRMVLLFDFRLRWKLTVDGHGVKMQTNIIAFTGQLRMSAFHTTSRFGGITRQILAVELKRRREPSFLGLHPALSPCCAEVEEEI